MYPSVREFCCSNTQFATARQFSQLARGSDSARASPHSAPTVLSSSTLASSLSRLGSKYPSSSCRRETYSLSESMGENYHGLVGSVNNSGGNSSSVSEVTSTVRDSHLFVSHVSQREADSSVGGSSVFDLERSNREGSGSFSISRFLLPSFLLKMSFTA